jgi:hypothetical protein
MDKWIHVDNLVTQPTRDYWKVPKPTALPDTELSLYRYQYGIKCVRARCQWENAGNQFLTHLKTALKDLIITVGIQILAVRASADYQKLQSHLF